MAWSQIPTRDTNDANASADINQLQDNFDVLVSGTPTSSMFTLDGSTGNVGIGTNPDSFLHVFRGSSGASAGIGGIILEDNTSVGINILTTSSDAGFILFGDESDSDEGFIKYDHSTDLFKFGTNGTDRMAIDASGNVKVGGTADRGTTVGTSHLDIFNGTAPAGTLTNGISFYSSSGEAYVMDASGNATLLSPHDEDNNWIYRSKDTTTGKVLKIDMEKMLKFLNEKFGTDFIHEYMEA